MYQDFAVWLTSSDVFKLGETFGFIMGVLVTLFIHGFVDYAVSKLSKLFKKDSKP